MRLTNNSLMGSAGLAVLAIALAFSPAIRADQDNQGQCVREAAHELAEAMRGCDSSNDPQHCRQMAKDAFESAREQCKLVRNNDEEEDEDNGNHGRAKRR